MSHTLNEYLNFFKKKRLVVMNGNDNFIKLYSNSVLLWELTCKKKLFFGVNEILSLKKLKKNCSWEKVLCAIGDLIEVTNVFLKGKIHILGKKCKSFLVEKLFRR